MLLLCLNIYNAVKEKYNNNNTEWKNFILFMYGWESRTCYKLLTNIAFFSCLSKVYIYNI